MYHDSSDTFRHLQQNGLQHLQKHCEQSPCSVRILQRMFARYQGFLEAQRSLVAARGIALSPSELTNEVKLRLCRQSPAFLICIFHSVVVYMCEHITTAVNGDQLTRWMPPRNATKCRDSDRDSQPMRIGADGKGKREGVGGPAQDQ